jgi:hypothetical protein
MGTGEKDHVEQSHGSCHQMAYCVVREGEIYTIKYSVGLIGKINTKST